MQTVCHFSKEVRNLISENQSWKALESLFNFVVCPISTSLKAAILNIVTALAKKKELVPVIWQLVEQAQV